VLKPLTSTRFFAAFFVFLSHLAFFQEYDYLERIFVRFFYEGYIGVTFFFVLSGFILTYNYHGQFSSLNKEKLANFYLARIARIYPVHILTFIIAIPLLLKVVLENSFLGIISGLINISLLQSFVPLKEVYFSINAVSWSLSNEMFFYILLPFMLFIITKFKTNLTSLLVLVAVIWAISAIAVLTFRDISLNHWLFYIFPFFRIGDFVIGVLLALIFLKSPKKLLGNSFLSSILEFSSILSLIIAIYFSPYIHQSLRYGIYYIPVMCFIIYVFAFQGGVISRLLSNRLFLFLGEISFSFYMIHLLVITYSLHLPFVPKSPIALACFAFFVSLIGSTVIHLYFEVPLRSKIRNLSRFKGSAKKSITQ